MKHFWVAIMYAGFFGLIGFAVYFLESGWPLLCLLLMPSYTEKTKN